LLAFQAADDVHVAKPQELRSGGYVFSCDYAGHKRWAALFKSAPGFEPEGCIGDLRRLGAALAVLHRQMACAFPIGRPFDAEATVSMAATSVSRLGRKFQRVGSRMIEAGAALADELNADGQLRRGVCHGDIWLGKNVHFDGPRTTFFDFDDCTDGPLVSDLATLIAGLWYAELTDFAEQLRAVLDAYATVLPLPASDVLAIPRLIRMQEIRMTGFLAHNGAFEPGDWSTVLQHLEQRLSEWGLRGEATATVLDYTDSARVDMHRPQPIP
jgi:Ser/Thr protein kinase RdoA (MazF antagonist)